MNSTNNSNKNKGSSRNLSFIAVLLIGAVALFGLQGCSSGSSSSAPPPPVVIPDQDASGLFKDGTAELNGGAGAIMLSDMRAFVHNGRILMFSVAENLLIDGQINSIKGNDYTATVDVYEAGVKTEPAVSVTGKVMTASQITGTLNGTGAGSGTFTLTFDPLYNRGA